ncbi:YadA-like family protein, partial [Pelistega europaea]
LEVETVKATKNIQVGNVNITNEGDPQYHGDMNNVMNVSGIDGQPTVITGVADGIGPNDAVNMNQLSRLAGQVGEVDRKVEKYKRNANAGTATAIAIASLPQAADAGANMLSLAGGSYDGETATAIGFSRRSDNGKFIIKANGSFNSRGKVGVGVGVGFQWR